MLSILARIQIGEDVNPEIEVSSEGTGMPEVSPENVDFSAAEDESVDKVESVDDEPTAEETSLEIFRLQEKIMNKMVNKYIEVFIRLLLI